MKYRKKNKKKNYKFFNYIVQYGLWVIILVVTNFIVYTHTHFYLNKNEN